MRTSDIQPTPADRDAHDKFVAVAQGYESTKCASCGERRLRRIGVCARCESCGASDGC